MLPSLHNDGYSTPNSSVGTLGSGLPSITEDPITKLERLLRDRDEAGDGKLDMQEFQDAVTEADNEVDDNDLEHIFKSICDHKEEIHIDRFVAYIKKSYHQTQRRMFIVSGKMNPATPKIAFRSAFPDVFGEDLDSDENREVWADAQIRSIKKLMEQFEAESENGVVDFAEFEAAIRNLGINFSKPQMNRLFVIFLGEQEAKRKRLKKRGIRGQKSKYELSLKFMAEYLEPKVEDNDKYGHLKPKQIIESVFLDLLKDYSKLHRRESFLK